MLAFAYGALFSERLHIPLSYVSLPVPSFHRRLLPDLLEKDFFTLFRMLSGFSEYPYKTSVLYEIWLHFYFNLFEILIKSDFQAVFCYN